MKLAALSGSNIAALFICFAPSAQAENAISLWQETKEIECVFREPHARYDRVVVDRKDTKLTAYKGSEVVQEFERVKYLDSAILLRSKAEGHALFQIFPNGQIRLTEGDLLTYMEKDCDDTGASKTCKTDIIQKIFWSPEKLNVTYGTKSVAGLIDNYGFLANHATYFFAREKGRKAPQSITLIDYGSNLHMIVGPAAGLSCKYL